MSELEELRQWYAEGIWDDGWFETLYRQSDDKLRLVFGEEFVALKGEMDSVMKKMGVIIDQRLLRFKKYCYSDEVHRMVLERVSK